MSTPYIFVFFKNSLSTGWNCLWLMSLLMSLSVMGILCHAVQLDTISMPREIVITVFSGVTSGFYV